LNRLARALVRLTFDAFISEGSSGARQADKSAG